MTGQDSSALVTQAISTGPVVVEALDNKYATGLFKGGISRNFDVSSDTKTIKSKSIFDYLQGKIAGLKIADPESLWPSISWRDDPVKFYINNRTTYLTDVREISLAEIDDIKIYDPAHGGAFGAYGGVISIYTKQGQSVNNKEKLLSADVMGYTPIKEFYSPNYAKPLGTLGVFR
jgi:hypothetical protein